MENGNTQPVTSNAVYDRVSALESDWVYLGSAFKGNQIGPFDAKYKDYIAMIYPNDNMDISGQFYMIKPVIAHKPQGYSGYFTLALNFSTYYARLHYWTNSTNQLYCTFEVLKNNDADYPGTCYVFGRQ